jgi:shikimate dehydrogenase
LTASKRLAVLGQPISHSRSPAIHTAALVELGLGEVWSYEAIEVAPEDFAARVGEMPSEGFVGANVTVPHKVAALAVADRASPSAVAIGAANTLSFADDRIAAENTDATGLMDALGRPAKGLRSLVLGAGGSARAVAWALVSAGGSVEIWNRTASRAESLAAELGASAVTPDRRAPGAQAQDYDLIVNATTVGMGAAADRMDDLKSLPIDVDSLDHTVQVVDLAYGTVDTQLVRLAKARGAAVVDGLEVLVRQGAASLRIWTGLEPPIEAMRRAARSAWPTNTDQHT